MLIRVKPKQVVAAGVERVPKTMGVRDGMPMLEDGRVLDVANVIWCTGFRHDLSWIDLPIFGEDGELVHERGVVDVRTRPVLRRAVLPVLLRFRRHPGSVARRQVRGQAPD